MKRTLLLFFFIASLLPSAFGQPKGLDTKFIASTYYKGSVKILLFDSLAEKNKPGSGYIGRGSGFILTEDAVIFSNRHVVEMCVFGYASYDYYDEQKGTTTTTIGKYSDELLQDENVVKIHRFGYPVPIIQVYSGNGENDYKLYYAKVISLSMGSFDGAVLKIISDMEGNKPKPEFQPLPIGNSDSTSQGEDLCVFGFPQQYSGSFDRMLHDMSTLTSGKHSGFDYVFNKDFGYIKTDAAINSGNSGGPVFNSDNKVIGIATATGMETNIGLVGGINAMYYVVAQNIDMLQKLSAKGLKVPRSAGAVNTVSGEKKPVPSPVEVEEHNKKKQAALAERIRKAEERKQAEAYNAYTSMLPQVRTKTSLGIAAGGARYSRGGIDQLWQTINSDPSLTATGEGSPFFWKADMQFLFAEKKEQKDFFGFSLQYVMTARKAIGAVNDLNGVKNEVALSARFVDLGLVYSRALDDNYSLYVEPAWMYVGIPRGTITAYGATYKEKGSQFATGWSLAAGINRMIGPSFALTARAGYRWVSMQEVHEEDRDGFTLKYSFFKNGIDGETTMVKWNDLFVTIGVAFSTEKKRAAKGAAGPMPVRK